jgi:hypothetical protein
MKNRIPSWFAQSAAACVLSGESLFGSACGRVGATEQTHIHQIRGSETSRGDRSSYVPPRRLWMERRMVRTS